jgi:Cu/Ag efflux pump CusA
MIDAIVTYALKKRTVVAMICVFVAIYGYYSWTQLNVEAYPDIADTQAQVVTQAPGWPPRRSSSASPFRWSENSMARRDCC